MKTLLVLTFVLIIQSKLFAVVLVISPGNSQPQCPLATISYSVTVARGSLPNCTYSWTIDGGSIIGSTTGTSINVKWNDLPGTGTLSVTAGSCAENGNNGITVTATYTRLSVSGLKFPTLQDFPPSLYPDSYSLPVCSNSTTTLQVDRMYIKNTGGAGEPVLREVDRYIWYIPSGWKEYGTGNVGPIDITTPFNFITVEPLTAEKGVFSVVGSIRNTCNAQGVADSNPKIIPINRTPLVEISAPSGYAGASCGLISSVTFSVTPLDCATGYSWVSPSGWSISSTLNNTVTLTPNGSSGGVLGVTLSLSTGKTLVRNYTISFINSIPNPTLTKSSSYSEICSGESWTFTCVPPTGYPTNYGFDWYATGGLLVDGVSTSSAAPLHTNGNTVTVSANSGSYGAAQVYSRVNINNGVCVPSAYVYLPTQVGPYSNSQFSISGPSTACPNTTNNYLSTYIDPSITNYQWGWSGFNSASGQGTPYLSATTGYNFTSGSIILRLSNRCGITGTPAIKYVTKPYCAGGYSFAVSPNPGGEVITVAMVDELTESLLTEEQLPPLSDEISITLVNDKSKVVAQDKLKIGKVSFDISTLPNGLYVMRINTQNTVITKQVIINH